MADIKFISCDGWSELEWSSYRISNGIGASENGTILNLNPYMSSLELHHLKTGQIKPRPKNLRMCIGNLGENLISDLFEFWDKDESKFLYNVKNNVKVRSLEVVNSYCTNSDLPFMFASLDRRFKENGEWVAVELKNKTTQSYLQYKNEINPMELMQIAFQLLVSLYKKAYLVYFINNTSIEVIQMTYEEALALKPTIVKSVKEFWDNVEKARICMNKIEYAKNNHNHRLVAELEMELLSYEPVGKGEAYLDYLTEKAKDKKSSIPLKGNSDQLVMARDLNKLALKRKKIEAQEIELKSKLSQQLHLADKTELDFGKEGKFSITNGRITNKVK